MLLRDTKNYGPSYIDVETEISYPSLGNMSSVIPYNSKWKNILIQVSGGLDSTLLLYLITKTFKNLSAHTNITPISIEVPSKAKNLNSARAVIEKVQGLLNYPLLKKGIEINMPMEHSHPPEKDIFFRKTINDIRKDYDFEFNGNNKNPPENECHHFINNERRELARDNRNSIYNSPHSASPHAFNDKSGIVFLYKKFDLVETLAPLTLSCDMNLDEIVEKKLSIPCGCCWWCYERAWGFAKNNLTDLSLKK